MKLAQIAVAKIKPSPHNPRHEAVDIAGLAASIAEVGVIEPLVLSEDPKKPGTYHVTCGSRRLAASKLAGLESVPAVILGEVGEKGERLVSLVENLHRRDMTHIEQGEAFLALLQLGMKPGEVAQACGVTRPVVDDKVLLVRQLILEAKDLVHRDQITLTQAISMARLSHEAQRTLVAAGINRRKGEHKVHKRRISTVETALRKALALWIAGDVAMAFAEASRAASAMKATLEDAVERPGPSIPSDNRRSETGPSNGDPTAPRRSSKVTDDTLPAGQVRCPHCLSPVKVRLGQIGDDALAEHGANRPFCREAIRQLATT